MFLVRVLQQHNLGRDGLRLPSTSTLTPQHLRGFFFDLYADVPKPLRMLIAARPYVCPYDKLVGLVPPAATVLDLGCGAGSLLVLLAALGRISHGIGCDVSEGPLAVARRAAGRLGAADRLEFARIEGPQGAPAGPFKVVTMIDVLHHIPQAQRAGAIAAAASRTAAGGLFLYKDMSDRPLWRRWAHTLDDLVFSHELVHQVGTGEVERWGEQAGLALERAEYIPRLVYGHELRVFRRRESVVGSGDRGGTPPCGP